MDILRVEIFLDGSNEPFDTITKAPFTVQLDPAQLSEGEHSMVVTTYYQSGEVGYHDYVFDVQHNNGVFVGYMNRAPLHAPVQVELVDPMERGELSRPDLMRYAVLPVLLFLLIVGVTWWLAYIGDQPVSDQVSHIEVISKAAAAENTGGVRSGEAVYAELCIPCHGPEGKGSDVFPAFADNADLGDANLVITTILNGREGTAMISWASQLSDEEIAAVASHIRSSWGNDFGEITSDQVSALR